MSILYINAVETLSNLNSSSITTTSTSQTTYDNNDGLYKLIDQMVNDLCSIKKDIKNEEKNILADLLSESRDIEDGVDIDGRTVSTSSSETATRSIHATSGGSVPDAMFGDGTDNNGSTRYTMVGTTANTFPSIYKADSNKYNEPSVFCVLHEAAIIIAGLKNGYLDAGVNSGTLQLHGTQII